jgi:hypothetical protein
MFSILTVICEKKIRNEIMKISEGNMASGIYAGLPKADVYKIMKTS